MEFRLIRDYPYSIKEPAIAMLLPIKGISDDITHVHSTDDRDVIVLKKIYQTAKGYYYKEKQGTQYSSPVKRVYLNILEEKELMMFLEKLKHLNVISNIKY